MISGRSPPPEKFKKPFSGRDRRMSVLAGEPDELDFPANKDPVDRIPAQHC
jgi:hypothetical protein